MIKEITPSTANFQDLFKALCESFYLPTEEKVLSTIIKWQNEGSLFIAYFENEVIIGAAIFNVQENVILRSIGVIKEKRRIGIGKAIIEYIKVKYAKTINLETDEESIEFYKKSGFKCYKINKFYDNKLVMRYICNY